MATEAENIWDKVYREAAQTILNSRREELTNRIDEIIDRVMGLNSTSGGHQYEEESFEGEIIPGGQNTRSNTAPRRRRMQRSLETGSNSSVLLGDLAMLTLLNKIIHQ